MRGKPVLIFDTSVFNALADDGAGPSLVAGLREGYVVWLTGLNFSEIIASANAGRRKQLLDLCRLFMADGLCLMPHHWIVESMAKGFHQTSPFDWSRVDVRFRGAEIEIAREEVPNDDISREEREHLRQQESELFAHLDQQRSKFQALFVSGTRQPQDYAEFISVLKEPGGAFWGLGGGMYERVTGVLPTEDGVRRFVAECPPFHAALLGFLMAQYERCIRDLKTGPSYRAGRYDLFMSVYLPFCMQFVTNDDRQARALQEVASVGGFDTEVRAYLDWRADLSRSA